MECTNIVPADDSAIRRAAEILRSGGLVAFPTETVYGLGADAANDVAVARIFEAKGRPRFNPLIVHVRDLAQAETLVEFSPPARDLAQKFWPGAVTLVLPRRPGSEISLLASAGLDTLAVRMPAHPVTRKLLVSSGLPIAAPSANRSGHVSPTAARHVASDLGLRVDLVLDGGPALLGMESTVIGFEEGRAILLRTGAVSREEIGRVVGQLCTSGSSKLRSPGQLASHYAPRAPIRLNAELVGADEALLAFGAGELSGARVTKNLSRSGDLKEAAANLFAMLRELDTPDVERIAVMPIPNTGLGEAINDRLQRAAAPRDATCR